MNKQLSIVLSACTLFLIASCSRTDADSGNNSEGPVEPGKEGKVILAETEAIKSSLNGNTIGWNSGDRVSVFDESSNSPFVTTDSGSNASFKGTAGNNAHYIVLYPYQESASRLGNVIKTSFLTEQLAVEGSFANGANLSAAITSEVNGLHTAYMCNVGCYLKILVEDVNSQIVSIEATSIGGESLSGGTAISFDSSGVPVAADDHGADTAQLTTGGGVLQTGTYYLVLRPGTLSEGLRVTIAMSDNSTRTYMIPSIRTLERNAVYALTPSVDYDINSVVHEGVEDEVYAALVTHEGMANDIASVWSGWTDAASVLRLLHRAAEQRMAYFTDYKYYDYEKNNTLRGKCNTYGYPLMFSADFFKVVSSYYPASTTETIRNNITKIVRAAWAKNRAIPAFSWHMENPYADYELLSGANPARYHYGADEYPDYPASQRYVARQILDNTNEKGDWFDERCQAVAEVINTLVDDSGTPIPVILRLFHECEHSWAWWQLDYFNYTYCSLDDYKALYRLAVDKIRAYCPDAQILFCYNTDRSFTDVNRYLLAYPGDHYVDIMSYDDYWIGNRAKGDRTRQQTIDDMLLRSRIVSAAAAAHGKVAGLFETNNNSNNEDEQTEFFSTYIRAMLEDEASAISFIGSWSINLTGDARTAAFVDFVSDEKIIFDNL